jgi:iron complex transport system substrate-binding protein
MTDRDAVFPKANRIVSLVPSATEMVYLLGLRDRLVGISHECDFPAEVASVSRVTRSAIGSDSSSHEIDSQLQQQVEAQQSLYGLDHSQLVKLEPDLILSQSICEVCAVSPADVTQAISHLQQPPRVLNLSPTTLAETMDGIMHVATATNFIDRGRKVVAQLHERVNQVAHRSRSIATGSRPRVLLLEWIDPPYSAGHWNPELISLAGGIELVGIAGQHSQRIEWERVIAEDPDVLIVACCGFDIDRAAREMPMLTANHGWQNLRCVQTQRAYLVDGSAYFNRPGPRLVDSLELLAHLLHPDVHPLPSHVNSARLIAS